jgi:hypothetical protein
MKLYIAIGRVRVREAVRVIENINSFHVKITTSIEVATRPGLTMGRTIRSRHPIGDAPSIVAASSISMGTSFTNPYITQITKGRLFTK